MSSARPGRVPGTDAAGYPPEDLLFHSGLRWRVEKAVNDVREASEGIGIVVGYPYYTARDRSTTPPPVSRRRAPHNLSSNRMLPNYAVFDEKRYFQPGRDRPRAISTAFARADHLRGHLAARPAAQARTPGADLHSQPQRVAVLTRPRKTMREECACAG